MSKKTRAKAKRKLPAMCVDCDSRRPEPGCVQCRTCYLIKKGGESRDLETLR